MTPTLDQPIPLKFLWGPRADEPVDKIFLKGQNYFDPYINGEMAQQILVPLGILDPSSHMTKITLLCFRSTLASAALQVYFYNFAPAVGLGLKVQKYCLGLNKIEDQRIGLL